ncbi:MAG: helix-turn-helix domain-containing protein [Verrucomicrobiota bacterium]
MEKYAVLHKLLNNGHYIWYYPNMARVGDRIRERRKDLGWTQDKLATKAKLSKGFLSDVENGKRNISADNLLDLATVLALSLDFLMKGEKEHELAVDDIQIPNSLSAFATTENLSYKQALLLLSMQRQIVAHRSATKSADLESVDWRIFYDSVKQFISE